MKKTRQIFGAIALSAVLTMGTAVPAFAVNEYGDNMGDADAQYGNATYDETNNGNTNDKASTKVNIATYSSHYSVTIPLVLPFMLDQMGGEGMAPTNYYIQNNGDQAAVEVYALEYQMAAGDDVAGDKKMYTFGCENDGTLDKTSDLITWKSGTDGRPTFGSFIIKGTSTLTPAVTFATTAKHSGVDPSTDNGFSYHPAAMTTKYNSTDEISSAIYGVKVFDKGAWKIAAATATGEGTSKVVTPTKDNITLGITGTKLASTIETLQENVASFVYTIGPARTAATA